MPLFGDVSLRGEVPQSTDHTWSNINSTLLLSSLHPPHTHPHSLTLHTQLAGGPDKQHLALLEVFAYGTVVDYTAAKNTLPHLSSAQLAKLRLLTIAELASRHKVGGAWSGRD